MFDRFEKSNHTPYPPIPVLRVTVVVEFVCSLLNPFAYILKLYPVITWSRAEILLPWLAIHALNTILPKMLSVALAFVFHAENIISTMSLIEFLIVESVNLRKPVLHPHKYKTSQSRNPELQRQLSSGSLVQLVRLLRLLHRPAPSQRETRRSVPSSNPRKLQFSARNLLQYTEHPADRPRVVDDPSRRS